MLRRQARLRREYIYRKSIESKEKILQEKKERLKKAIDGLFLVSLFFAYDVKVQYRARVVSENRKTPTDLQGNALELQKAIAFEGEGGEGALGLCTHSQPEQRRLRA